MTTPRAIICHPQRQASYFPDPMAALLSQTSYTSLLQTPSSLSAAANPSKVAVDIPDPIGNPLSKVFLHLPPAPNARREVRRCQWYTYLMHPRLADALCPRFSCISLL